MLLMTVLKPAASQRSYHHYFPLVAIINNWLLIGCEQIFKFGQNLASLVAEHFSSLKSSDQTKNAASLYFRCLSCVFS